MIPYPYNFVDMGGIDLAEANGTVVDGLYSRIAEAATSCGEVMLYNWKFAEIEITPQHTNLLITDEVIVINGMVQVTEQDMIIIPGETPPTPEPVIVDLFVDQNGTYIPEDYDADAFGEVTVDVEASSIIESWDFRGSNIVGSINKIAPYQYRSDMLTQNGLVLGESGYVRMPFKLASAIFEFDIAASAGTSTTARFFMVGIYGSGSSPTEGFAWSYSQKWGFYRGAWEYTEITDPAALANSTIAIEVDDAGTMFVRKNGELLCKSSDGLFLSRINDYVVLGSSTGSLSALITGLRIIRKGE